ncbi:MAG: hypothetical protein VX407_00265 [Verrucomicrobiota bacterium]|nr:hypothetical protein [Verrucomicrobiota bacterium]
MDLFLALGCLFLGAFFDLAVRGFFLIKDLVFLGLAFLAKAFDFVERDLCVDPLLDLLFFGAVALESFLDFEEVFPTIRRSIQYDIS